MRDDRTRPLFSFPAGIRYSFSPLSRYIQFTLLANTDVSSMRISAPNSCFSSTTGRRLSSGENTHLFFSFPMYRPLTATVSIKRSSRSPYRHT